MRIDPKTFTLDANDRAVIAGALAARIVELGKRVDRKRASSRAWTDKARIEIDSLETQIARAQDLITAMAK